MFSLVPFPDTSQLKSTFMSKIFQHNDEIVKVDLRQGHHTLALGHPGHVLTVVATHSTS